MLRPVLPLAVALALLTACNSGLYGESTGTDCPTPSESRNDDDDDGVRYADEC